MAVKIRLSRHGRKKNPFYHIIVADSRSKRDGKYIEKIGTYNPNLNPAVIDFNEDKALEWLLNGAQPTETVKAMLSYRGVMYRKHLQIGVLKGAIKQEDADKKYEAWRKEKDAKITGKETSLAKSKADAEKKAMDAETKIKEARTAKIQEKQVAADAAAAAASQPEAEATEEEATDAPAVEVSAEAVVETPAAEAPVVEETPVAETPVTEEVKEEPKAEAAAPTEEKAEETKE